MSSPSSSSVSSVSENTTDFFVGDDSEKNKKNNINQQQQHYYHSHSGSNSTTPPPAPYDYNDRTMLDEAAVDAIHPIALVPIVPSSTFVLGHAFRPVSPSSQQQQQKQKSLVSSKHRKKNKNQQEEIDQQEQRNSSSYPQLYGAAFPAVLPKDSLTIRKVLGQHWQTRIPSSSTKTSSCCTFASTRSGFICFPTFPPKKQQNVKESPSKWWCRAVHFTTSMNASINNSSSNYYHSPSLINNNMNKQNDCAITSHVDVSCPPEFFVPVPVVEGDTTTATTTTKTTKTKTNINSPTKNIVTEWKKQQEKQQQQQEKQKKSSPLLLLQKQEKEKNNNSNKKILRVEMLPAKVEHMSVLGCSNLSPDVCWVILHCSSKRKKEIVVASSSFAAASSPTIKENEKQQKNAAAVGKKNKKEEEEFVVGDENDDRNKNKNNNNKKKKNSSRSSSSNSSNSSSSSISSSPSVSSTDSSDYEDDFDESSPKSKKSNNNNNAASSDGNSSSRGDFSDSEEEHDDSLLLLLKNPNQHNKNNENNENNDNKKNNNKQYLDLDEGGWYLAAFHTLTGRWVENPRRIVTSMIPPSSCSSGQQQNEKSENKSSSFPATDTFSGSAVVWSSCLCSFVYVGGATSTCCTLPVRSHYFTRKGLVDQLQEPSSASPQKEDDNNNSNKKQQELIPLEHFELQNAQICQITNRVNHSATSISDNEIIVVGGQQHFINNSSSSSIIKGSSLVVQIDLSTGTCRNIELTNNNNSSPLSISPRYKHGAAVCCDTKGNRFLILGGGIIVGGGGSAKDLLGVSVINLEMLEAQDCNIAPRDTPLCGLPTASPILAGRVNPIVKILGSSSSSSSYSSSPSSSQQQQQQNNNRFIVAICGGLKQSLTGGPSSESADATFVEIFCPGSNQEEEHLMQLDYSMLQTHQQNTNQQQQRRVNSAAAASASSASKTPNQARRTNSPSPVTLDSMRTLDSSGISTNNTSTSYSSPSPASSSSYHQQQQQHQGQQQQQQQQHQLSPSALRSQSRWANQDPSSNLPERIRRRLQVSRNRSLSASEVGEMADRLCPSLQQRLEETAELTKTLEEMMRADYGKKDEVVKEEKKLTTKEEMSRLYDEGVAKRKVKRRQLIEKLTKQSESNRKKTVLTNEDFNKFINRVYTKRLGKIQERVQHSPPKEKDTR